MRRSGLQAPCGRFLVADPAPLWQRPLVALSGLFLKSPVQVRRDVWRALTLSQHMSTLARHVEHVKLVEPCRGAPKER